MKESKNDSCCSSIENTLAFLLLRLWLATRAIVTGIEKFGSFKVVEKPGPEADTFIEVKEKFYALTNYAAIPPSLKDKFAQEPLLPTAATTPFYASLGWLLILLGVMLLLGIGTRISLFLQGLLYTGLTVGLILIKQDDGIAWLGIHVGLVALALLLVKHNRLSILKKW
jgi:DoxX.